MIKSTQKIYNDGEWSVTINDGDYSITMNYNNAYNDDDKIVIVSNSFMWGCGKNTDYVRTAFETIIDDEYKLNK